MSLFRVTWQFMFHNSRVKKDTRNICLLRMHINKCPKSEKENKWGNGVREKVKTVQRGVAHICIAHLQIHHYLVVSPLCPLLFIFDSLLPSDRCLYSVAPLGS
ncbi:hypothetical protein HAX54_008083 [Datura stramonium]|uniref:Uncharacterized protein n=1 Tax=Datura stramonium TaxID=4076 RepID=A0ABS8WX39_DATST|nr:hypothetical protein [Datura stramonium]